MRWIVLALLSLLVSVACFPPGTFTPQTPATSDVTVAEQVANARSAALKSPGNIDAALRYAQTLWVAYESGAVERGAVNGAAFKEDAVKQLDTAAAASPERGWEAHATKGSLLLIAGDRTRGLEAFEASMAATPNTIALASLIPEYVVERRHEEIDAHCENTYATATDNNARFAVLEVCASAREGMSVPDALPWASADDHVFFEQQLAIEDARVEAERTALEAQRAREQAELEASFSQPDNGSGTSSGGSSSAASGPQRASVTLKNNCRDRVRVFFGDKPKYGSGTYSWISSNSVSSYSMDAGDMLWIVDESDNPMSSTSVPAGSSRIEILDSCTGFTMR